MIDLVLTAGPWIVLAFAWVPAALLVGRNTLSGAAVASIGVLWLLLVQGDALLGPFAHLEWGDGDRLFQGYFPYLAQQSGARFLAEIMGGTDRYALGRIGGEYFSPRLLLLHIFPLWAVTLVFRFAVGAAALCGTYLFCRRAVGAPREVSLAFAMMYTVAFDFTATLTFLYGLSLAGMPLLLYLLYRGRWLQLAAYGALYIGTADPIYWLPLLWVMVISTRLWLKPRSDFHLAAGLALLSAAWIANYADTLLAFTQMLPWSARGSAATSLGQALSQHLDWLIGPELRFNHGGPLYFLPVGFSVLVAVLCRNGRTAIAAGGAIAVALAQPFLGAVPWTRLGLPFLASYRWYWEYGAFALALFAAASACAALEDEKRRVAWSRWAAGGAIAMGLAMLMLFKAQVFLLSATRGNISNLTAIPNLVADDWRTDRQSRVVGVPTRIDPNSLVNYGFSTLDGGATLVHGALHQFWVEGVARTGPLPSREMLGFGLSPEFQDCCDPLAIDAMADVNLLRLANVGYLVSYRALSSPLLTQVAGPAAQTRPSALSLAFGPAAPAFVYRLSSPMGLAYAATGVTRVPDDIRPPELIAQLRLHALAGGAVMREGDIAALGLNPAARSANGTVRPCRTGAGYRIDLADWSGGVLLLNVPYLPWWTAVTQAGETVPIGPANLIQMAMNVPGGARSLFLTYDRALISDLLHRRTRAEMAGACIDRGQTRGTQ